jgi:hypothetical protein
MVGIIYEGIILVYVRIVVKPKVNRIIEILD